MLRGNALATVDDKGRLKLPAGFRRSIEENFGRSLFVTSLRGDHAWLYPLAMWQQREQRILALDKQPPAVSRFLARVSYFGAEVEMDPQGRIVIPPVLRSSATMEGEVAVLGALTHLEIWNNAHFRARLDSEPFTDADLAALSELGL